MIFYIYLINNFFIIIIFNLFLYYDTDIKKNGYTFNNFIFDTRYIIINQKFFIKFKNLILFIFLPKNLIIKIF